MLSCQSSPNIHSFLTSLRSVVWIQSSQCHGKQTRNKSFTPDIKIEFLVCDQRRQSTENVHRHGEQNEWLATSRLNIKVVIEWKLDQHVNCFWLEPVSIHFTASSFNFQLMKWFKAQRSFKYLSKWILTFFCDETKQQSISEIWK